MAVKHLETPSLGRQLSIRQYFQSLNIQESRFHVPQQHLRWSTVWDVVQVSSSDHSRLLKWGSVLAAGMGKMEEASNIFSLRKYDLYPAALVLLLRYVEPNRQPPNLLPTVASLHLKVTWGRKEVPDWWMSMYWPSWGLPFYALMIVEI